MEDEHYEVVIVRYGTRETVRRDVYLNYGVYGLPDGPIRMDYFVWIIRNERRTILVDTGFSRAGGAARNRTMLLEPLEAWRRLGIDASTASHVIVTHAHYDHIGNLEQLPAAEIVLNRAELDFWTGPHARRRQFHHSVEDAELSALSAAADAGRITFFDDRMTVAPGVEVIRVGGHTPGQSVVLVQTADGPALLASDAVHYLEELEEDMPFVSVAQLVEMYAGFDTVRELRATGAVRHVVAGHDPGSLDAFEPLGDPLPGLAAVIGRRA